MELGLLYEKIFNAMLVGGAQSILEAAYEVIKLPLVVVDTGYNLIAVTKERRLTDDIWDYFFKAERLPDEIVWSFFKDKYIETVCSNLMPVYLNWGDMDIPRISGAIKVNGIITAYIGVLCPASEFKEELLEYTDIIAKAVAMDMSKHRNISTQNKPLLEIFTRDLISSSVIQEKQLEIWKSNFKEIFKGDYLIAAISPPSDGEFGLLQYFSTIISSGNSNVLSTILSDTLFLFFYEVGSEAKMKEIIKVVGEKLSPFHTHYSISKRFPNILDVPNYRFQVEKALELGGELNPRQTLFDYDDYFIPTVFSYALKEMSPANYVQPLINKLAAYDKENNTDYLITLENYVLYICNSRLVTEKLHIHRNTLLYRLNKIAEIMDCDLDDEELFTKLLLSFRMIKLKRKLL